MLSECYLRHFYRASNPREQSRSYSDFYDLALAVIHVTSTILYWSYRDSFTGMKLCSHTGRYIQKSPALGLKH